MSRDPDTSTTTCWTSSPEEGAAVERRMGEDAGFRREVRERMRPIVAGLEALPPEAWPSRTGPPPLPAAPPAPRRAPRPSGPGRGGRGGRLSPPSPRALALPGGGGVGDRRPGLRGRRRRSGGGGPAIALARVGEGGSAAAGQAPVSCPPTTAGCGCGVSGLAPSGPGGLLRALAARRTGAPAVARLVPGARLGRGGGHRAAPGSRRPTSASLTSRSRARRGDPGHSGVSGRPRGPTGTA